MFFRLAYIFRRPISEIKKWPVSEILSWQTFFRLYGPLDWEREDLRDARRVWLRFGKEGSKLEDLRAFPPPKPVNPYEKPLANLQTVLAICEATENEEGAAQCRKQIETLKREAALYNA